MQGLPKKTTIRKLLPVLRRQAFQNINLKEFDVVISSSGAEAKSVKKLKEGALHITYCHSPTHYYWARYDDYLKEPGFGMLNPIARSGLKIFGGPMRKWDYKVAQRPDVLIANSNHIKSKILQYYDRESVVVHPPVDINRFSKVNTNGKRKGLVISGRQVPYKRIDLAIKASIKLHMPLTVIGNGPMHNSLKELANGDPNITFLTNVSDNEMPKLLASSELFLFPGIEDFGIAPVEAIACGTPVIAFGQGGALDYVNDITGILFDKQTTDSLTSAILTGLNTKWHHDKIAKQANQFSAECFKDQISQIVSDNYKRV